MSIRDDREQLEEPVLASSVDGATLEQLHGLLGARFAASEPSLLAWSRAFRLEDGGPLDFDLFPFQREIYDAFGDRDLPTVDVRKSVQCGISAAAVSLALYAADRWGADVIYVLPTEGFAETFSDTRVGPAIEASPYLRSRVTGTDTKGLKRLGRANLYFVGSVAETNALSIPADVLCFDEFDRLHPAHIATFEQRLASPTSMKLIRRFSTPTVPEAGIDERYLASDQRCWLVRCEACGREAPLAYEGGDEGEHCVQEDIPARVCGRCHRPLCAEAIASGRWVARHPEVSARGYHVSKLIVPAQDVSELVAERARTDEHSITAHYNCSLGLPYAARGGSLTREILMACRRKWRMPESYSGPRWVTAGVDVGKVLHVRVSCWDEGGRAVPLFIGEVPGFEDLANVWERYNVNCGVIDERPEEREARSFMNRFTGRVKLARWSGQGQHDEVTVDEDQGLLIARRSWACDQTVDHFRRQRKLLPSSVSEAYLRQMTAPHRTFEERDGQKVARYVSGARADHYFFAETYDLLANHVRPVPAAGAWGPPPEPAFRGGLFHNPRSR